MNTNPYRLQVTTILARAQKHFNRSISTSIPVIKDDHGLDRKHDDGDHLVLFSYDSKSCVGTLSLNDPKRYNALSMPMGHQFKSVIQGLTKKLTITATHNPTPSTGCYFDSIMPDCDISKMSALILTGSGNKAFCTGADYSWLRSLNTNPVHVNADIMYSFYDSFLCIRELPVPTIAAIHGTAIGMGACLALACDLRIILGGTKSRPGGAKIGFPFGKLGMHPGMGGSHFAPIIMGESQAMEALLLGKVFDAEEALRVGLVNRVTSLDCKDEDNEKICVKQKALELAMELTQKHPLALRSMVRTMRMREDGMGGGLEAALRREALAQALCYDRKDFGEGINAILERRNPEFGDYGES